MKLHLPMGLRKALMAVLAILPSAAVAVTFAATTAMAESSTEVDDLILVRNPENSHQITVNGDVLYGDVVIQRGPNVDGYAYGYKEATYYSLEPLKDVIKTQTLASGKALGFIPYTITGDLLLKSLGALGYSENDILNIAANGGSVKLRDLGIPSDIKISINGLVKDGVLSKTPSSIPDKLDSDYSLTVNNGSLIAGNVSSSVKNEDGTVKDIEGTLTLSTTDTNTGNITVKDVTGPSISIVASKDVTVNGNVNVTKDGSIIGQNVTVAGTTNLNKSTIEANVGDVILSQSAALAESSITANGSVKISGDVSLSDSSISATTGGVTILGNSDLSGGSSIKATMGLVEMQGSNSLLGAKVEGNEVLMGSEGATNSLIGANVSVVGVVTKVTGKEDVQLSGGLNAILGTASVSSTSGNVTINGAGQFSFETLAPIFETATGALDSISSYGLDLTDVKAAITTAESYLSALDSLGSDSIATNVNLMLGGKVTADKGTVTLNSTANMLVGIDGLGGLFKPTLSGKDVSLNGTFNVLTNSVISGNTVELKGRDSIGLSLDSLVPEEYQSTVEQLGVNALLNKELNANMVMDGTKITGSESVKLESVKMDALVNVIGGGSTVSSDNVVTLTGGVNLVVDTTMNDITKAITTGSLDSLMAGGDKITTLSGSFVNLHADVNIVNGTQVQVSADDTVSLQGVANVVASSAKVDGTAGVSMDGIVNVVAGGATVNAGDVKADKVGNITMSGGMAAVVDTTLANVVDALKTQSIEPLMQGGNNPTKLIATGNIELGAALNVVNGGQVFLNAGGNVEFTGTANLVSGNSEVTGQNIIMSSGALDGVNLNAVLPAALAGYAQELGVTDALNKGANANIVAGGAYMSASQNVEMSGLMSAIVDTTLTNVVDAVLQQSIDPLLKGGYDETYVHADADVKLNSLVNVVNGGMVTVDAGNDVQMNGSLNYVGDANVTAANDIIMKGTAAGNVNVGALVPDSVKETLAGMGIDAALNGKVNTNIVSNNASLTATNGNIAMNATANVVTDSTVKAKQGNVALNGSVSTVVNSEITAEQGNISINGGGKDTNVSVVTNSTISAEHGSVSISNTNMVMSDSSVVAGTGLTVKNATAQLSHVEFGGSLSIDSVSEVVVNDKLVAYDGSTIENFGSLSLKDVAISNSTLYNAGSMEINGQLFMQSVTLVFEINSLDDLSSTAITMNDGASFDTLATYSAREGAADAISAVKFVIAEDVMDSLMAMEDGFELQLFKGVDQEVFEKYVSANLQEGEFTIARAGVDLGYDESQFQMTRAEDGTVKLTVKNDTVPEPTTATLSLLALAALAARRRRK